jgi:cyanate permease
MIVNDLTPWQTVIATWAIFAVALVAWWAWERWEKRRGR